MKNKLLKITFTGACFVLGAFACIKPTPPIVKPITEPGGGNDPKTCKCDFKASGTIEKCLQDSSIWFINANVLSSHASISVYKLLLPVNLNPTFKIDGLTVRFEYKELPDSVVLDCGLCETYPPLYAQKIKLCKIEKDTNVVMVKKPNIYFYPTKETRVDIKLNYQGRLTTTYPDYDKNLQGWSVMAKKGGTLKNIADQLEYQYIFWEGTPAIPYNFNMQNGFCVKGSETKSFLQNVIPKLGLIPKEYNEMIVFWLPQMMNNPYNLIHFATDDYTKSAPLTVTPKPDNMIRVFMAYQPSQMKVKTNEPTIICPKRTGFTVVEWGGAEIPLNLMY